MYLVSLQIKFMQDIVGMVYYCN